MRTEIQLMESELADLAREKDPPYQLIYFGGQDSAQWSREAYRTGVVIGSAEEIRERVYQLLNDAQSLEQEFCSPDGENVRGGIVLRIEWNLFAKKFTYSLHPRTGTVHKKEGAVMKRMQKKYDKGQRDFRGIRCRRADLRGINLAGADLSGAYLMGADLREAHLERTNLSGAILRGVLLGYANLSGANLSGADLDSANLYGTRLEGANLEGAFLLHTSLVQEAG